MRHISHYITNYSGSHPRSFSSAALFLFLFSIANTGTVLAQNIEYTKGNTDSALRSNLTVDPSTLGMSIQVPLASYPGRGGELPVTLRYASKQWRLSFMDTFQTGTVKNRNEGKWAEDSVAGWTTSLDLPKVIVPPSNYRGPYTGIGDPICTAPSCNPPPPPTEPILYINRLLLQMPDGSSLELRKDDSTTFNSGPDAGIYYAVDGSNIRYDTATSTVFLPDGSRYLLSVSGGTQAQYIDRNGNTMTYTFSSKQWTDTLGRNIRFPLSNLTWGDVTNNLPGVNGSTLGYTLKWRYLNECLSSGAVRVIADYDYIFSNNPQAHTGPSLFTKYLFTDYVVSDGAPFFTTYFNPIVLKEIVLPNGKSYTFSYNIYGEIDKVIYPTGGYERFAYGAVPGLSGSMNPAFYSQANRGVTDRWVSVTGDGSDEAQHHSVYSVDTTGPYLVRVTAPNGVKSERLLHRSASDQPFGFDNARTGRAYEERIISAAGQMLRRTLANWAPSGPTPAPPAGYVNATRNARVTKTVEILLDTGGDALAKTTTMNYDPDLNVIETKQYDFASVDSSTAESGTIDAMPLGAHIKTNKTLFLLSDSAYSGSWTTYRNRNLVALPTATWVETPGGTVTARTEFVYDEAAYAPLSNPTTATQWSDPGTTARGTATTVRRWLNITTNLASGVTTTYSWPCGQWLVTHTQTDVCGNVRKTWDERGKMSEIKYDGDFSDGDDHDAYAFPTEILTPPPYTGGDGGLGIPFGTDQQLTTSMVYDFSTGKVVSTTDANDQTTTYSYAGDLLQRATSVTRPAGGGETIYEYNDTPGTCACDVRVKTRTLQSAGVYVEDYVFFDGAGRAWRRAHGEGGGKWSVTDTQYDNRSRVWKTANPALTGPLAGAPTRGAFPLVTANVTTMTYDDLGRVLTVTTPDGSVVTTTYSGNQVTVADQANGTPNVITGGELRNTTRRSVIDGLGRLKQVVEAPDSLDYTTNYTYDTLDNLRQVSQGVQNRYFLYDSVGRLARARNPEQGVNAAYNLTDPVTGSGNNQWTLKYAYDENGNLKKRWDPRSVVASYNYDDINRNIQTSYSDGTAGPETYYDGATGGKGRSWRTVSYDNHPITAQIANQYREITNYDAMGRPTEGNQQFLNSAAQWVIYSMSRTYDLMGRVTSQTYPSNREANYSYTAAGRLSSFSGDLGDGVPRTYADEMAYNAAGQLTSERFGTQTQPLYHTMNYNSRHQMYDNKLGTSAGGWNRGLLLTYYSVQARNIGAPHGEYPGNNGNVWMQEHFVPTNDAITTHTIFRDIYEYDDLNRLKRDKGEQKSTANVWTFPHQQTFNYDQWGNRTIIGGADTFGANITNMQFTVDTATNRLGKPGGSTCSGTKNGMCYDQAGNLIFDNYSPGAAFPAIPGGDREYDGENRIKKGWGAGGWNHYVYDGDGQRVRRVVWEGGFQKEYWQVYDFDGALIAEYLVNGLPAATNKEYGYRNGQLLLVGGCDVARWIVADHLGTPRIEVDVTGNLANVRRHDYLAFGEELTAGMGNGSLRSGTMGYAADCVRQRFGSKERDNETGLDYFLARYYSNIQGRFTSVDPENAGVIEDDPQSWNGYAYARNNPLLYSDPDGRKYIIVSPDGKEYYEHSDDEFNNARRAGKKDGFTFTGDGKYFEKGEIRDKDGNVIATYQQTSLDDQAHNLAFHLKAEFRSSDLYVRSAGNTISGAMIGALLGGGTIKINRLLQRVHQGALRSEKLNWRMVFP